MLIEKCYFVTSVCANRTSVLQTDRMSGLFLDVLRENRAKQRIAVHAFVVMLNHVHILLTPQNGHSLAKCMQFIKGGFSYRAGKELGVKREIWQPGYTEHFIQDSSDYAHHIDYIHNNPVRGGLVMQAHEFPHSSIHKQEWLDAPPDYLHAGAKAPK